MPFVKILLGIHAKFSQYSRPLAFVTRLGYFENLQSGFYSNNSRIYGSPRMWVPNNKLNDVVPMILYNIQSIIPIVNNIIYQYYINII